MKRNINILEKNRKYLGELRAWSKPIVIGFLTGAAWVIALLFANLDLNRYARANQFFSSIIDARFHIITGILMISAAIGVYAPGFLKISGFFYARLLGVVASLVGSGTALFFSAKYLGEEVPEGFLPALIISSVFLAIIFLLSSARLYRKIIAPTRYAEQVVFSLFFGLSGILIIVLGLI